MVSRNQIEQDKAKQQEAINEFVRSTRGKRKINTTQITIRIAPDKLAKWEAAADAAQTTLSDYIRSAVDASIS